MIDIKALKAQIEDIEIDIETHYDFIDYDESGYHRRSIQRLNVEKERVIKKINAILFNSGLNKDLQKIKSLKL